MQVPATAPTGTFLPKPRMRGLLHLWSFAVSLATGATLITLAATTVSAAAAAAVAIYSVTVSALFGTSALYHRRAWARHRTVVWISRLDHSMIFVFIAGSYTPFTVLALPPDTGRVLLLLIWAGAAAGVAMKLLWPLAPRWLSVPIYIGLGWVAVFVLPDLLAGAGVAALALLLTGGLCYTLGAIAYALRRPDPWPRTFGYHEIFHAGTVLGAICHYTAVWLTLYAYSAT